MQNISDHTLRQLDALNNWLGDIYGEGTHFSTLLINAGFSNAEIEQIKLEHLNEFLHAVIDLLAGYRDLRNEHFDNLMVQHYGLSDGKPQDIYSIGANVGVCGERIRQLIKQRLVLFQDPERQEKFQEAFTMIGRRLLDNKSTSQA